MAAIPPYREDPPVGTGGVVPAPRQERDAAPEEGAPPPAPVEQPPPLPKDWSPATPPSDGDTAPPGSSSLV